MRFPRKFPERVSHALPSALRTQFLFDFKQGYAHSVAMHFEYGNVWSVEHEIRMVFVYFGAQYTEPAMKSAAQTSSGPKHARARQGNAVLLQHTI